MIVIMVVVLGAYFILTGKVKAEIPTDQAFFIALCKQWNETSSCSCSETFCSPKGIGFTRMNEIQDMYNEPTLTEICNSSYPSTSLNASSGTVLNPTNVSVIRCQDACRNNCYTTLYYDLSVYPADIFAKNVTIYNESSASVFNFSVVVTATAPGNEVVETHYADIPGLSSKIVDFTNDFSTGYVQIQVDVDADDKFKELKEGFVTKNQNNRAKRQPVS